MQGLQRLGIAVGAPLLLAGLIGGAVAFASDSGGSEEPQRPVISQQDPNGAAPGGHDKDGCPEKDGGTGASASEL